MIITLLKKERGAIFMTSKEIETLIDFEQQIQWRWSSGDPTAYMDALAEDVTTLIHLLKISSLVVKPLKSTSSIYIRESLSASFGKNIITRLHEPLVKMKSCSYLVLPHISKMRMAKKICSCRGICHLSSAKPTTNG